MSEQLRHEIEAVEEVDAIVVADARPLPAARSTGQIVKTQAAVAAGSFVAGAATVVVVAHRRARKTSRRTRRGRRSSGGALEIAGSRSFLVDVHLLQRRS
jgi:hypothetical protein